MKHQRITHYLLGCLLGFLCLAGCKEDPQIMMASDSICVPGKGRDKACLPLDGTHMAILKKEGGSLQLAPLGLPAAGDPQFREEERSAQYIQAALRADGRLVDFDPKATEALWENNHFILKDKESKKVLLQVTDATSGFGVYFAAENTDNVSLAWIKLLTCGSDGKKVVSGMMPGGDSTLVLCGKKDNECHADVDVERYGPVIVVQIDNIIGDEPAKNYASGWKEWIKAAAQVKFTHNHLIDFIRLDPVGGNNPHQQMQQPTQQRMMMSDAAARSGTNFQLVFKIPMEGLMVYECEGRLAFEHNEVLISYLTATGRTIWVRKDCEQRCYGIYAEGMPGADDWVDHKYPEILEIGEGY